MDLPAVIAPGGSTLAAMVAGVDATETGGFCATPTSYITYA